MEILSTFQEGNCLRIKIQSPELNIFSVQGIQKNIYQLIDNRSKNINSILLDLTETDHADSSGIAFMVKLHLKLKKLNLKLKLCNVNEKIIKTLEFANLVNDFEII